MLGNDEEEIVRRGLAASSLLENQDFVEILRSLTVESFAVFTETKPDEQEKREAHYHRAQALQAIEGELRARVHQKDEIERRLNEAELEADAIEELDEIKPTKYQGD